MVLSRNSSGSVKKLKMCIRDRSSPAYGGLGGGYIWTVTDWNFYGHYGSFSGWEAISHEHMHCMDYSHDSNMTYPAKTPEGVNVGWPEFIWQLHMWPVSYTHLFIAPQGHQIL